MTLEFHPASSPNLALTVSRAVSHLCDLQLPNGAWSAVNYGGPACTAIALITESFLGTLRDRDRERGTRWLLRQQRSDGSYPAHPFANAGDLDSTCLAFAALFVSKSPGVGHALARARLFIDGHGGLEATRIDTRSFLVMARCLGANSFPALPFAHKYVPGLERFMIRGGASWTVLAANYLPGLSLALRQNGGATLGMIERNAAARIVKYLSKRQNPGGDWFGTVTCTALCVACLHGLGVPSNDRRIQASAGFLRRMWIERASDESFVAVSPTEVWDSAWAVRALLAAGVSRSHPSVRRAQAFFGREASQAESVHDWSHPPFGSHPVGGWGWHEGNAHCVDNDDTAIVLAALLRGVSRGGDRAHDEEWAIECALSRLLAMQNADGSWSLWTRGHWAPEMPLPAGLDALVDAESEGITGRVLQCLPNDARFERARRSAAMFLKRRQRRDGAWEDRRLVHHYPAIASAIGGLAASGEDLRGDAVRRAVKWVKSRQQTDGGWGEAEMGSSQPTTTGFALCALIDAGECHALEVQCGIEYLCRTQTSEGGWLDTFAQAVVPCSSKLPYVSDHLPKSVPLLALGKYQQRVKSSFF